MLRAWIVLAAADGLANGAIARELEISVNIVRKWGGRFAALGPDGLRHAERSGRPKSYGYGPDVRVAIEASISAPPHPGVTWSHRAIAQRVAGTCFAPLSASQVGRILAGLDLKPHKVRGWLTRRDTPDFWQRAAGVCALCPGPPEGRRCSRSTRRPRSPPVYVALRCRPGRPGRPARRGEPDRQELQYRRHGTASLVTACDVRTGEVLTEAIVGNDAATCTDFLDRLDRAIALGGEIRVVLGDGSSHTARHTRTCLVMHPTRPPTLTDGPTEGTPLKAAWSTPSTNFRRAAPGRRCDARRATPKCCCPGRVAGTLGTRDAAALRCGARWLKSAQSMEGGFGCQCRRVY